MADYSKRTKSGDKHLADLTGAKWVHIDGSKAQVVVRSGAARLLRIVICTKGINFIVRSGSDVIGNFATTTPEGTYYIAVYCANNITIDVVSGTGSATIVHGD